MRALVAANPISTESAVLLALINLNIRAADVDFFHSQSGSQVGTEETRRRILKYIVVERMFAGKIGKSRISSEVAV